MNTWINTTAATTSTGMYMPVVTTTSNVPAWVTTDWYTQEQPARPQGPLEWLDSEVEKTCALARQG